MEKANQLIKAQVALGCDNTAKVQVQNAPPCMVLGKVGHRGHCIWDLEDGGEAAAVLLNSEGQC